MLCTHCICICDVHIVHTEIIACYPQYSHVYIAYIVYTLQVLCVHNIYIYIYTHIV